MAAESISFGEKEIKDFSLRPIVRGLVECSDGERILETNYITIILSVIQKRMGPTRIEKKYHSKEIFI